MRSSPLRCGPVRVSLFRSGSCRTENAKTVTASANAESVPRPPAKVVRRALAVFLMAAITAVGLIGTAPSASAAGCSGPLAAGTIRVVLVVDATDIGGGSSATCFAVPAGTTGSQLLARRGAELGTGAPRYGSSGLLCAIDGRPATGCGDRSSGGFEYWAYFNGTSGSWVYGSYNPFVRRLSDGDIEGWRYVSGAGNGQDPPPRISPSRSLFPALAPAVPVTPDLSSAPLSGAGAGSTQGPSSSGTPVESRPTSDGQRDTGEATVDTASPSTTVAASPEVVDDVALASSTSGSSTTGRWISIGLVFGLIAIFAAGAWRRTRRSA